MSLPRRKELRRIITGLPLCRSQNLCDQVAHYRLPLPKAARALGLCAANLIEVDGRPPDLLLLLSWRRSPRKRQQYGSTIMAQPRPIPVLIELIRGLSSRCSAPLRTWLEGTAQRRPDAAERLPPLPGGAYDKNGSDNLGKALRTATESAPPRTADPTGPGWRKTL